jgi:hypothetical protein
VRLWLLSPLPTQIRMSQEVANFFVAEARRNLHKAKNILEEDDVLIYNFKWGITTGQIVSCEGMHGGQQPADMCFAAPDAPVCVSRQAGVHGQARV